MFFNILPKSRQTVFLHIGTNKTGTTSIQKYLFDNRVLLKKNGILYPFSGLIGEAHYALSSTLGFSNSDISSKWKADFEGLRKQFNKEVTKSNVSKIIVSSENFMLNSHVQPVRDFFDGYDVKVIVYLRRHDEWWESAYTQALKMKSMPPWPRGVMGFINYHQQKNPYFGSYRVLLDRWASVFGKENIIVRPFERQQNKPNLIIDFLQSASISPECTNGFKNPERLNESISRLGISLLDVFQRVDIDNKTREKLIGYALDLPMDLEKISLISPIKKRELIDKYTDEYTYIANEYLGDGVQLFYEGSPIDDDAWRPAFCDAVSTADHVVKALSR